MYSSENEQERLIKAVSYNEETIKELEYEVEELKQLIKLLQTALTNHIAKTT